MPRFQDLGVFVFKFWVLRFRFRVPRFRHLGSSFSSFGYFLFEALCFRDLGASCFGLRFPVLRFRNYHYFHPCYRSLGCTQTVNGLDPIQHQLKPLYNAE